ncbi:hypothetical protein C3469_14175 [Mycobacterium kansasii]|uniref:hypothetical protein n=1 Tax=Mycobacterium kansasii TaxID=1768 RepID=UPI000CDDD437|nr:hypothetical protein [Mycobacterium kansasii]POX98204.1 hypothetical protein C3479_23275 [Mycobacterium kansasii]POY26738.1 hypothetical protein C3469_14175 [Mycobacterium kansasii]POY32341.1 hypothetical protein C3478_11985 [Mycobacterium kansasii]
MGVGNLIRLGAASGGLVMAVLAGGCGSDNPVIDSSNRGSNSHTVHISPAAPLEIPLQSSIAAGQPIEQVGKGASGPTASRQRLRPAGIRQTGYVGGCDPCIRLYSTTTAT